MGRDSPQDNEYTSMMSVLLSLAVRITTTKLNDIVKITGRWIEPYGTPSVASTTKLSLHHKITSHRLPIQETYLYTPSNTNKFIHSLK